MPNHTVRQGECLSSIAESNGFTLGRLWNLSENAVLRQKRKNPNVLFPGDIVFVPTKENRYESRTTDKRHRFQRMGRSVELRLRLLSAGQPIANESYQLKIAGTALEGETDEEGKILRKIPYEATEALLWIDQRCLTLQLAVGCLDPVTEITGVQARLNNLGYRCGAVDGCLNPKTRSALKAFQETYRLTVNGEPDVETQDKLKGMHGC